MKGTVYFYDKHIENIIRCLRINKNLCVFATNTANYICKDDGNLKYFWRVKHIFYGYGGYKTVLIPVDYINKIILKEAIVKCEL